VWRSIRKREEERRIERKLLRKIQKINMKLSKNEGKRRREENELKILNGNGYAFGKS